jgi:hypothetical protein
MSGGATFNYDATGAGEELTVNLSDALDAARRLQGVRAVAILDVDSGIELARAGGTDGAFERARARRAAFKLLHENVEALEGTRVVREILYREADCYHLLHVLPEDPETHDSLCLHLTLDGDTQNLALILSRVSELVRALEEGNTGE